MRTNIAKCAWPKATPAPPVAARPNRAPSLQCYLHHRPTRPTGQVVQPASRNVVSRVPRKHRYAMMAYGWLSGKRNVTATQPATIPLKKTPLCGKINPLPFPHSHPRKFQTKAIVLMGRLVVCACHRSCLLV